jgi:hypothetical protein
LRAKKDGNGGFSNQIKGHNVVKKGDEKLV